MVVGSGLAAILACATFTKSRAAMRSWYALALGYLRASMRV